MASCILNVWLLLIINNLKRSNITNSLDMLMPVFAWWWHLILYWFRDKHFVINCVRFSYIIRVQVILQQITNTSEPWVEYIVPLKLFSIIPGMFLHYVLSKQLCVWMLFRIFVDEPKTWCSFSSIRNTYTFMITLLSPKQHNAV